MEDGAQREQRQIADREQQRQEETTDGGEGVQTIRIPGAALIYLRANRVPSRVSTS
jgi:hypothetical protein